MKYHLRTHAQRLLHAFAEAGNSSPTQELQPLIGPNGALMWTEPTTRVSRPPADPQLIAADTWPASVRSHHRTNTSKQSDNQDRQLAAAASR